LLNANYQSVLQGLRLPTPPPGKRLRLDAAGQAAFAD